MIDNITRLESLIHRAGFSFSYFTLPPFSSVMSGSILMAKPQLSVVGFNDPGTDMLIKIRPRDVETQLIKDSIVSDYEKCLEQLLHDIVNELADDEEFNGSRHDKWFEDYEKPLVEWEG